MKRRKNVILAFMLFLTLCACTAQRPEQEKKAELTALPSAAISVSPEKTPESSDAIRNHRYSDYLSQDEPLNLTEEEVGELLHLLRTAAEERENKPDGLHGTFTGTSLCFDLCGEENLQVRLDAVSDGRINVSLWDASAEEMTNDQLYAVDLLEWIQQKTGYRILTTEELRRITKVHCSDAALDEETVKTLLSVIQSGEAIPSDGPHELFRLEFETEDGEMFSGGLDLEGGLMIVENGAYGPIDGERMNRVREEIKQQ